MLRFIIAVFAGLMALQAFPMRAAEPTLPNIPGITTRDMFPGGCVDCHRNRPEIKRDFRISTYIRDWTQAVDPKVRNRVQAIAPKGVKLSGKHPPMAAESFRDVPKSCNPCHANPQAKIPQMGPMLHALHLMGGTANHFLTLYKGECALCHKFDSKTASWRIPSLPER